MKVDINFIHPFTKHKIKINGEFKNIIYLKGPNGSGKSSFFKFICGLLPLDNGHIIIEENVLFNKKKNINLEHSKRNIILCLQHNYLFPNYSVLENILFFCRDKKQDLSLYINEFKLEKILDLPVESLSGGEIQKICLLRALLARPKIMLLDESFFHIDSLNRSKIIEFTFDFLAKNHIKCFFTAHFEEEFKNLANLDYETIAIYQDCLL